MNWKSLPDSYMSNSRAGFLHSRTRKNYAPLSRRPSITVAM
jgi:hypothetical protein